MANQIDTAARLLLEIKGREAFAALNAEMGASKAQLDELVARFAAGELSLDKFTRQATKLEASIARQEATMAAMTRMQNEAAATATHAGDTYELASESATEYMVATEGAAAASAKFATAMKAEAEAAQAAVDAKIARRAAQAQADAQPEYDFSADAGPSAAGMHAQTSNKDYAQSVYTYAMAADAGASAAKRFAAGLNAETQAEQEAALWAGKVTEAVRQMYVDAATRGKGLDFIPQVNMGPIKKSIDFGSFSIDASNATGAADKAAGAFSKLGAAGSKAGFGILLASQAIDDAQYGFSAIANNIPGMVMAFGGSAGLAGAISVAATGISILTRHTADLGALWGKKATETEAERFKKLAKAAQESALGVKDALDLGIHERDKRDLKGFAELGLSQTKANRDTAAALQESLGKIDPEQTIRELEKSFDRARQSVPDKARPAFDKTIETFKRELVRGDEGAYEAFTRMMEAERGRNDPLSKALRDNDPAKLKRETEARRKLAKDTAERFAKALEDGAGDQSPKLREQIKKAIDGFSAGFGKDGDADFKEIADLADKLFGMDDALVKKLRANAPDVLRRKDLGWKKPITQMADDLKRQQEQQEKDRKEIEDLNQEGKEIEAEFRSKITGDAISQANAVMAKSNEDTLIQMRNLGISRGGQIEALSQRARKELLQISPALNRFPDELAQAVKTVAMDAVAAAERTEREIAQAERITLEEVRRRREQARQRTQQQQEAQQTAEQFEELGQAAENFLRRLDPTRRAFTAEQRQQAGRQFQEHLDELGIDREKQRGIAQAVAKPENFNRANKMFNALQAQGVDEKTSYEMIPGILAKYQGKSLNAQAEAMRVVNQLIRNQDMMVNTLARMNNAQRRQMEQAEQIGATLQTQGRRR